MVMYEIKSTFRGPLSIYCGEKQSLHLLPREKMVVEESIFLCEELQRLIKKGYVVFLRKIEQKPVEQKVDQKQKKKK